MEFHKALDMLQSANERFRNRVNFKEITLKDIERVYDSHVLLSVEQDYKTSKSVALGYLTGILYLAPADLSGIEVCPNRSAACTKLCLFSAGKGSMSFVLRGRLLKTFAFHFDRERFLTAISRNVANLGAAAKRRGLTPCVRLNGTSDIPWEYYGMPQRTPDVQFYDYTKSAQRMQAFYAQKDACPPNLHLTFSYSGENWGECEHVLSRGGNVAVVFRNPPEHWIQHSMFYGYPMVNGDAHDLRFLDPAGVVVALRAKGRARKAESEFVVNEVCK